MSDNAFARSMDRIAAQAEAEQLRELEQQRRQRLRGRLLRGAGFVFWAAVIACGFFYRVELQEFASEKIFNKPKVGQVDDKTGNTLKGIQEHADKRDGVLNELAK